ncbi:hypothetical protein ACQ4PT_007493 [Festuca glaucescens]
MAELGGMLAAAILKVVGDQIGSEIGGQITLQKNFDEDLQKMKMALESVDAVLEDAERRSITDKSTRLWLKRLKDFMYVISDMIDEFEADTEPSARKCSFKKYLGIMIPCLTIGPKIKMANRMEKMRGGSRGGVKESEYTEIQMIHKSLQKLLAGKKILIVLDDLWEGEDFHLKSLTDMLKLCFAYCAIFPKGHKIVKNELIHQWVSLGFSTWQLGERCISQLLGLSFLEHSNSPSNIELYDEDITLLTMHDLVHDLARTAMDNEILVISKGDNVQGSCYHYALLDDCSKPLVSELSKIRALRFMKCAKSTVYDAAFSSANSLRVLDLSECIIHKLPDSIGVLKQLRYLNAPGVQHTTIPDSITKLSKIIYLDIHGSRTIVDLPESIGDIEGMVYLNLSGCSGLAKLPESFRRLQKLVHLDMSNCSRVGGISVFLGNLTQLQYLNLSHCQNIGEMPGVLSKLEYLNLSFSSYLESCQEGEVLGALNKLEYLNLSSKHCSLLKLPEALGTFIQLKYLNLSGCQSMSELPRSFQNLKSLVHLDLSDCRTIDCLDESLVGLSNLQYLNLQGTCIKLLPSDVNKLRYLNLGSNAISLPYFGLRPGDGDSSSNLVLLQHIDPVVLKITELENVKSVEEAQRINLTGKQKLEFLELEWTRDGERFVDDKVLMENLVPPRTLKKLEICGYNGVSFPTWLVLDQLPNLEHLVLRGMANLEEWNTSYSSGEEHMIGQLEIHDCPMLRMKPLPPKTKKWKISNSANVLSSWEECTGPHTNVSSSFSAVTTELWVDNCNVPLHQWSLLQHFPGLTTLVILGSVDLTGSPEVIRHLSTLQILRLEDQDLEELPKWLNENMWQLTNLELIGWKNMASLPHWFGELTSLKKLFLWDCAVLSSLPESIQQLTHLKKLYIRGCPELNHLGERVCLLPSSLETLRIWYCNGIKCLPEGMEQLTNLYALDICYCPDLKQWCELEENMMKLARIERKLIIHMN